MKLRSGSLHRLPMKSQYGPVTEYSRREGIAAPACSATYLAESTFLDSLVNINANIGPNHEQPFSIVRPRIVNVNGGLRS